MWENPNNSRDYLFSNCYKVIGQDPKDMVVTDIVSLKTGVSLELIKNELENKHLQMAMLSPARYHKSVSIEDYYHILNKSETEILFNSLEQIFYQMFQFEIENRSVRRRFCSVTQTQEDSSGQTARRVLTSRQR